MTQPAAERLLNLADRAERHGLTPQEAQRLRDGINGLLGDLDAMEHIARSNKAHVAAIVPELEAATDTAVRAIRLMNAAGTERDRYRAAWTSARQRAQAHSEGTLRHIDARDTWKGWTKKAEAERDAALARLHELGAALTDPEPSWQCPDCAGLVPTSQRHIHQEAEQRARAERAEASLAALHEGEEPHDDERVTPTPAQWIWLWNRASLNKRFDVIRRIQNDGARASACFLGGHEQRLDQQQARLTRLEAERVTLGRDADRLFTDAVQQRARAERAEAAIERVRATCDRLDAAALNADGVPLTARERGMHTATTRIRAALDEHQERPTS